MNGVETSALSAFRAYNKREFRKRPGSVNGGSPASAPCSAALRLAHSALFETGKPASQLSLIEATLAFQYCVSFGARESLSVLVLSLIASIRRSLRDQRPYLDHAPTKTV
jgi:hypothetical protein